MESLYPDRQISYAALKQKFIRDLNIGLDDRTVEKYLGRPPSTVKRDLTCTIRYPKTGAMVFRDHSWNQKVKGKKGLLETMGYATMIFDDKQGLWIFLLQHEHVPRPYHYVESLEPDKAEILRRALGDAYYDHP